jgi:hypothetical protein
MSQSSRITASNGATPKIIVAMMAYFITKNERQWARSGRSRKRPTGSVVYFCGMHTHLLSCIATLCRRNNGHARAGDACKARRAGHHHRKRDWSIPRSAHPFVATAQSDYERRTTLPGRTAKLLTETQPVSELRATATNHSSSRFLSATIIPVSGSKHRMLGSTF